MTEVLIFLSLAVSVIRVGEPSILYRRVERAQNGGYRPVLMF